MMRWIFSCFLAVSFLLTSCSNGSSASSSPIASTSPAKAAIATSASPKPNNSPDNSLDAALAKFVQLKGKATVVLKLESGTVTVELDGENAPVTAGNFADLVDRKFYDGLTFHRVVKEPTPFVAQGGDPLGTGTGNFTDPVTNQPRYIPLEILPEGSKQPIVYGNVLASAQKPKLGHKKGAIAMARSQSPNSASCQFYFALDDIAFLDGSYAVFGYVTEGMDLVEKIKIGDRIESITLSKEGKDKLKQPI